MCILLLLYSINIHWIPNRIIACKCKSFSLILT
uniref:Uncharacterized protein n=1 Tax=Rhizophora mucronata TaxID=61149 RepID=A0A2P2JLM6_RHIMU